jgi:hypothetical protein
MRKRTMTFYSGLVLFFSALCVFSFTSVSAADLVSVKDGSLSVNLKDTSLLEVARDIEKQSGIWFRGDETLFQEKISVTFNDLSLEEGLKRILTNLNYSLMFDTKNKIAGVMVMGEGTPAGTPPGKPGAIRPRVATPPATSARPTSTVRSRTSPPAPPAAISRRPPRVAPQSPSSSAAQSPLPEAFKVQENAQIPGGPLSSDGPLPPAFRTIENAPPPGAPVAGKETPQPSRAVKNAPPPSETEEKPAVSPEDSKPAKNPQSTEEASKKDTTP